MINGTPADAGVFVLSEGPSWSASSGRLCWVDIESGTVQLGVFDDADVPTALQIAETSSWDETVGCAMEYAPGAVILAAQRTLVVRDASGRIERSAVLLPEHQRFNDGKVDPHGRLLVGSLTLHGESGDNVLLRFEADGGITTLDDDLGLSNGLGWSPDGAWFYSIDTEARTVYRRSYTASEPGEREIFIVTDGSDWPDGMSVDSEGNLWIAMWGGGAVRVYGPDGALREDLGVTIDAPHCSSITFAGPNLDVLVATSASRDLSPAERERWPAAGGLFLARSPIAGTPATPWRPHALPTTDLRQDHSSPITSSESETI